MTRTLYPWESRVRHNIFNGMVRSGDERAGEPQPLGTCGKYELVRLLATGGMAELFLARATGIQGFEKMVVLKRILPQHARNGQFIRMFLQEARLVATLEH